MFTCSVIHLDWFGYFCSTLRSVFFSFSLPYFQFSVFWFPCFRFFLLKCNSFECTPSQSISFNHHFISFTCFKDRHCFSIRFHTINSLSWSNSHLKVIYGYTRRGTMALAASSAHPRALVRLSVNERYLQLLAGAFTFTLAYLRQVLSVRGFWTADSLSVFRESVRAAASSSSLSKSEHTCSSSETLFSQHFSVLNSILFSPSPARCECSPWSSADKDSLSVCKEISWEFSCFILSISKNMSKYSDINKRKFSNFNVKFYFPFNCLPYSS